MEWHPHDQSLRAIGVYDGNRFRHYYSIEAFLREELTEKNAGKRFYAHAGGLFDVSYVLHHVILKEAWKVSASFSASSAVAVTIERDGHKFFFTDSFFFLRSGLDKIARFMGTRKGTDKDSQNPTDAEQTKLEMFYADIPTLLKYLEQDCVILWDALRYTQTELFAIGCEMKVTAASTGMTYFRHRFLKEAIPTSDAINRIGREAYYASRVEIRRPFMLNAWCYDINSSFPYAMTFPLPGRLVDTCFKRLPKGDRPYLARVRVRIPEMDLPPCPFRHNGRVYFPVGEWGFVWLTGIDVELLLENGGEILEVDRCLIFEPQTYFRDYAMLFYGMRKEETDPFRRELWKILMNAAYGKTAENEEKTQLLLHPDSTKCRHKPPCDVYDPETGEWEEDTCLEMLFPGAYLETKKKPIGHVHTPIAAYITAIARRTLYNWLKRCPDWGYCDTDSCYTGIGPAQSDFAPWGIPTGSLAPGEGIPTSEELGDLKLDPARRYKSIRFLAPKVYAGILEGETKQKVRAKGFPGLDDELFNLLEAGFAVGFRNSARVKGLMRSAGQSGDLRDTRPRDGAIYKALRGVVRPKRCLEGDVTRPWHVQEILEDD
jgi:hypothetical protein